MGIPWKELQPGRLLVIDGYEQLSLGRRLVVLAGTKVRGVQLLVTSHRPTMLGSLCNLSVSVSIARQILSQVPAENDDLATVIDAVSDAELQRYLDEFAGNMREVLMKLYDRFEEQRSTGRVNAKS